MKSKSLDDAISIEQLEKIVEGIGETFAPFAEVVLHDLTSPDDSIKLICNNLSGRQVGSPSTELGLKRIKNPNFPQIISNYENQFSDGRKVKSTSIGIKNNNGDYVAAVCINVDISLLNNLSLILDKFTRFNDNIIIDESLLPASEVSLKKRIDHYATDNGAIANNLNHQQKIEIIKILKDEGYLNIKKSALITTNYLNISRATFYNYLSKIDNK
nr:PAS domain-containing protein [uncultured Moellerella sp.]